MDTCRLANVIFDRGQKITESHYNNICKYIDTDRFTLDEYVISYKLKESFMGRIAFKLADNTKVLVSESCVKQLSLLNINRKELEEHMNNSYDNFKQVIGIITNGNS